MLMPQRERDVAHRGERGCLIGIGLRSHLLEEEPADRACGIYISYKLRYSRHRRFGVGSQVRFLPSPRPARRMSGACLSARSAIRRHICSPTSGRASATRLMRERASSHLG